MTEIAIAQRILREIGDLLAAKNAAYGNSAFDPLKCFSRLDAEERLFVRIDDKISRITRGHEYPGDDTIRDLIGYLVLLLAHKESQCTSKIPPSSSES